MTNNDKYYAMKVPQFPTLLIILMTMMNTTACNAQEQSPEVHEMKTIYFAGGCFWGTEHYFQQIGHLL